MKLIKRGTVDIANATSAGLMLAGIGLVDTYERIGVALTVVFGLGLLVTTFCIAIDHNNRPSRNRGRALVTLATVMGMLPGLCVELGKVHPYGLADPLELTYIMALSILYPAIFAMFVQMGVVKFKRRSESNNKGEATKGRNKGDGGN